MLKGFGRVLFATVIVVAAVAIAEQYDTRIAWLLAIATVFAILFSYPQAAGELQKLFKGNFGA